MKNACILITGASGCVGQYTCNWLLKNTEARLLLLIRDPKKLTAIDPSHPRVDLLIGDPTKSNTQLGWTPEYNLEELVNEMMESDLKLMTKDQYLKDGGYTIMKYFE